MNAEEGPLHGLLDLDRVALGGHSAGGTIALNSADHRYFPQVRAVFSYAAHTMASTMFGWPAGTVLPLSGDCPALVMSGTEDGLVARQREVLRRGRRSASTRSSAPSTRCPTTPTAAGSWLLSIKGANHFSIAFPHDGGLPRLRDDLPATADRRRGARPDQRCHRAVSAKSCTKSPDAGAALAALLDQPPLVSAAPLTANRTTDHWPIGAQARRITKGST